MKILGQIQSEENQPLLFRTCEREVTETACSNGSLWLRTSAYYQSLEDSARNDKNEGVNATKHTFPLHTKLPSGAQTLSVGCTFATTTPPNYIISLHSVGISETARLEFGGFTFGVKSIDKLTREIAKEASKSLKVSRCIYGPIKYQQTAYKLGYGSIVPLNSDILRKDPIEPFILQDEWRIALFVERYLDNDKNKPLKVNVSTSNFYRYIDGSEA